jgi:hypothetical protein
MKRVVSILLMMAAGMAVLTACAKPITVEEILVKSSQAMGAVETVKFTIERQGDPASITLGEGVTAALISAIGEYASGDGHALVKADVPLLGPTEADVLWVDEKGYFQALPVIPIYIEFSIEGFSLTTIFTGHGSISHVLSDHLFSPTLVGEEDLEGTATYHVQGQVDSAELEDLTAGYIAEGTAILDFWIDKATFHVVRLVITEADGNGWQIDLYEYGADITIEAPQ